MLILASRVAVESNSIYYYRYNMSSLTKHEKSPEELKKLRQAQLFTGVQLEEQAKQYNVPQKIWDTFMTRTFEKQTKFCKDIISDEVLNEKNTEEKLPEPNSSCPNTSSEVPNTNPIQNNLNIISGFEKFLLKFCWLFIWNTKKRKIFRKKILS